MSKWLALSLLLLDEVERVERKQKREATRKRRLQLPEVGLEDVKAYKQERINNWMRTVSESNDHLVPDKSQDSVGNEEDPVFPADSPISEQIEDQSTSSEATSPIPPVERTKAKRKFAASNYELEESQAREKLWSSLHDRIALENSPNGLFSKFIAAELDAMDEPAQRRKKLAIMKVLYDK